MAGIGHVKAVLMAVLIISNLVYLGGCSISNSAGSASDSAGSIANSSESVSDSSTSSSNGEEKEAKVDDNRFADEVQDYTVSYLRTNTTGIDNNNFMKGLSKVASQHGIVDWEANPKTYRAIGKGLKKSSISSEKYIDYKSKLSGGDSGKMGDIQEGYDD